MVVVFGCGSYTKRNLDLIESVIDIDYMCDNNEELQGTTVFGKYKCISIEQLSELIDLEVYISVENIDVVDTIKKQLEVFGIRAHHINEKIAELVKKLQEEEEYEKFLSDKGPRIVLLGAPAHSNLGDQAQSYCFELLMKEKHPDIQTYIFEGNLLRAHYYVLLYAIKNTIKENDTIVIHSGYHCTDLFYKEELLIEKIMELFPDKKLLVMPQTIRYMDDTKLKQSVEAYRNHKSIILMCRDKVSYEFAKKNYENEILLYPDIVTSLIGRRNYNKERKGILLCLRKLKSQESVFDISDRIKIFNILNQFEDITITDTDSRIYWKELRKRRELYIEQMLEYFSQFSLVVTDRYHGVIFSLIAKTPVVVLPSADHKLESSLEWFDCEKQSIEFVSEKDDNLCEKLEEKCKRLLNCRDRKNITDSLYQTYYKNFDVRSLSWITPK